VAFPPFGSRVICGAGMSEQEAICTTIFLHLNFSKAVHKDNLIFLNIKRT